MNTSFPLARAFAARRPAAAPDAALDALLAAALVSARAAWPGVDLPGDVFAAELADRCDPALGAPEALAQLHAADLYLAVACARGDDAACQQFDAAFVSLLPAVLASLPKAGGFLDEARQLVRQRLLVASDGPPRIAAYAARGPLEGWFRAAALRVALNMRRSERARPAETTLSPAARPPPGSTLDAESALAVARHRDDFDAALARALRSLGARERLLLKWHYFEGLPLSRIAALEGVGKSTVGRRLEAARDEVLELVRAELQKRLRVPSSQLSSLVRVLLRGADATFNELLSRSE